MSTDAAVFKLFEDGELYTLDEAAARMKVTRRQINRAVYSNWIRSVRMPSGRRLLGADLNRFLAERLTEDSVA